MGWSRTPPLEHREHRSCQIELPAATFRRGHRLSEADYQALPVPPGWQTECYRGVVLVWTVAEAEASDRNLEGYRDEVKRWIEQHASLDREDQAND